MFRTYPESELPIPPTLAVNGERSWLWIELTLQIPYYMATISIDNSSHTFRKTILFSDIHAVLQVFRDTNETLRLERVDVMLPEYLHQGDGYKLERIKEVWMSDNEEGLTSFVLADGSNVYDSLRYGIDEQVSNMQLVASFY